MNYMQYVTMVTICCTFTMYSNFITDSLTAFKGYQAYQKGQFEKAATEYATLVHANPNDASANFNMGLSLYQQKKYSESQSYFKRAIQNSVQNHHEQEEALFNYGNTCTHLHDYTQAIDAYEKVLKINSNNHDAQTNLEFVKRIIELEREQKKEQEQQSSEQDTKQDEKKQDKKLSKQDKNQTNESKEKSKQEQSTDEELQDLMNQLQQQSNEQVGQEDQQRNKESNQQEGQHHQNQEDQKKNTEQQNKQGNDTTGIEEGKQDEHKQPQQHDSGSSDLDDQKFNSLDEKSTEEVMLLDDALAEKLDKQPQDDQRLGKRSALLLQNVQNTEDSVQKQILRLNVTKQGSENYGQKNW